MKKKIFTLFLVLIASVGTINAESGTCGKNLTWDLTDGVLTISGTGAMYDYSNKLSDKKYAPWNSYWSSITSLIIKEGVTSIGKYAFYRLSKLPSVTIPISITSIGDGAFYDCSGLTAVHISDLTAWFNVEMSGSTSNPLSYAHNLYLNGELITGEFVIPSNITSIGQYAFYGCTGLTSIEIPSNITSIGQYAFYGCTGLTSVTIPSNVTSIGRGAFSNCSNLTKVILNSNAVVSYSYTLNYSLCSFFGSKVTTCIIGDGITGIGECAFYEFKALTSITIPNSVTSIGNNAFRKCSSLTSVTIPNGVTSIEYYVFKDCSSLTSVTIPNSVTSIGSSAFSSCSSLKSVTIPDNVTSIDKYAFYGCKSLTSVTIPNGVTSINDDTFQGCTGLTSVTIPNSVTSIGGSAFKECGLTTLTIPSSVTRIYAGAFAQCGSLTSVTCEALNVPRIVNMHGTTTDYTPIFNSVECSQIPLYVPAFSVDEYKEADQWKEFNPILAIPGTEGIEDIHMTSDKPVKVMNNGQVLIIRGNKTYTLTGQEVK